LSNAGNARWQRWPETAFHSPALVRGVATLVKLVGVSSGSALLGVNIEPLREIKEIQICRGVSSCKSWKLSVQPVFQNLQTVPTEGKI